MTDGTYTLEQIRGIAGDLGRAARSASEEWARAVLDAHHSRQHPDEPLPIRPTYPPTRRERMERRLARLRWRWADYRGRVALAVDVLRNRHDCYY